MAPKWKKKKFANYAENCSKIAQNSSISNLKMPEFVTCIFLKRLKTKEFEGKKIEKTRISKKKKTEMIVWNLKIYKKWVNGLGFFEKI